MITGVPVHVPSCAVSVSPSVVVPVIDGSALADGGAAVTIAVGSDVAATTAAAFAAVTSTRRVEPTSSAVAS